MSGPLPQGPYDTTWLDAIKSWCETMITAGSSPATITTRRRHLEQLSRQLRVSLNDVTRQQLTHWSASHSWSRETRYSYHLSVRLFCCHIGRADLTKAVPTVRRATHLPRPCPDDVYHSALREAEPRTQLVLRLAREAGLRRSEIARLNRRDFYKTFDGWVLHVRGKGDRDRSVPCSIQLATAILAWLSLINSEWVFPGDEGGHLSPRWIGKLGTWALPGRWTLHTLRHAFATAAYVNSHNILAVQQLLGHTSLAITMRYVAIDSNNLRAVACSATPAL